MSPERSAPPAPTELFEGSSAPWDAARRAGASFRAVGNEPGWLVTVYPDSLAYLGSYGEVRRTFTQFVIRPTTPRVYQTLDPGPAFTMTVSDEACSDVMSGEPFEATVVVEFDGAAYRGCGRSLD